MLAQLSISKALLLMVSLFLACVVLYITHIGSNSAHHHQYEYTPPKHFTKYDFMIQSARDQEASLSHMPDLCFLHVGKTAGTSLKCSLGFQPGYEEACGDDYNIPEGYLPLATTQLVHNHEDYCSSNNKNNNMQYLFPTRNPLKRIVSWYTYEYPRRVDNPDYPIKKPLYLDCPFGTLEDLAVRGLGQDASVSPECQRRAYNAIHGVEKFARHNYYNYHYYLSVVPEEARRNMFVIRTEHLVDDWNSIEAYLTSLIPNQHDGDSVAASITGITPHTIDKSAFPRSNPTPQEKRKNGTLSEQAQELLCAALCHEIQIYKSVLKSAINLSPQDVEESLLDLRNSCPKEASLESCPDPEPERRHYHPSSKDGVVLREFGVLVGVSSVIVLLLLQYASNRGVGSRKAKEDASKQC